ncbi:hypothetical protein SAMN02745163_03893 [Clostridium cavendishii DSM 21758]|uniref:Uncharacterized protein n=1 Tax=Clostridium cavendishii DSM 21758 TaxID=1121302 RepID=A0A1M6SVJ8_9CLOT|nr:hypothetical protein [Clostridium cavendishii]SHK48744.1 hypothetical protein SAMN02745163_03893 [Clostridium cavendishii DSM 21758]
MEHIEMLVGYDINNFEKRFEENYQRLSVYMYKFFKHTIGEKVAGIQVEQNLLLAWSYYFVTIADEKPENGDSLMQGLVAHFNQIMTEGEDIEIKGDKESHALMLDHTFTRIWFGTSVYTMLNFLYGEGKGEQAMKYLEKEYLVKNEEYRSMMLQQVEEVNN